MNTDKIDDVTLALLQLVMRQDSGGSATHASMRFDAGTLQRLQAKGLLGEIDEQAGVVALTGEGAERSRELFAKVFGEPEGDEQPAEITHVEPDAEPVDTSKADVYLHDAFLDTPVSADETLQPIELETVERNALLERLSSRQLRGGVYLDTVDQKVIRTGESDPAPPAHDDRFLEVAPLPSEEYWHDMSDFASLVRNGDLAAWIHDVVDDSETVQEFCEQLDRVDGLLEAWREFERDRARHRTRRWLAGHGFALPDSHE